MADDVISGPVGDGTRLPFSGDDVPREEYSHGERFGTRFRHLGELGSCSHVGVRMGKTAPGRRAYVARHHMLEEEHALVLDGRPMLAVLSDLQPRLTQTETRAFSVGQLPHGLFLGGSKSGGRPTTVQVALEAEGTLYREPTKPLRWCWEPAT